MLRQEDLMLREHLTLSQRQDQDQLFYCMFVPTIQLESIPPNNNGSKLQKSAKEEDLSHSLIVHIKDLPQETSIEMLSLSENSLN